MDVVNTSQHNIVIIQKEMIKNPVSLQKKIDTHNMNSVKEALTEVIKTATFFSINRQMLVVLAQSRQTSDDDDDELFAFVGETYQSHNSDIVDVLTELLNEAQFEIDDTRDAKSNVAHHFAVFVQFLEDQLTQDNKALEKAKADKTEFAAALATQKVDLAEASKSLESLKASQAVALDHETSMKAFAEELKTSAEATQVIQDQTGRAKKQTYSLFQASSFAGLQTKTKLKGFRVVVMVKKLAKQEHSANDAMHVEQGQLLRAAESDQCVLKVKTQRQRDTVEFTHSLLGVNGKAAWKSDVCSRPE